VPVNFEDDLRAALRREPAPADFASKILARTVLKKPRVLPFWRRPAILAIAAVLLLAAVIPPAAYQYRRQKRALEARDQLIVALSITKAQLLQAKEMIRQNTRRKQ
jgi:hypothetical protein